MVGFSIKKVNSLTLGEKLKEIRESLGVSLNEIAKATKIRKQYLEKIEEGRYGELPPEVYVKGFLKSYAKYLDIEVRDVLKLYEKERGIEHNIKKHRNKQSGGWKKFSIPSVVVTPKALAAALFFLLISAGFVYFYKEVGKFSQAPRLVVTEPAGDANVESSQINVAGITDGDSKVAINGQAVIVDENGRFNEQISLSQGMNEMEIESTNRFGNKTQKKIRVSANFETQIAQNQEIVMGAQDQKAFDKIYLKVEIVDFPVWVSVETDGNIAQSGTMLAGSFQEFEAQEKISITSGRADKTIIYLNGEKLGSLGTEGTVIRDVIFTKETKIMPEPQNQAPKEILPVEEEKEASKPKKKKD